MLALAGVVLAGWGCGARSKAGVADDAAPALVGEEDILVVQTTKVAGGALLSGTLQPVREARLRAELAGSVLQASVEPGQAVRQDQVLVEIDPTIVREDTYSLRAAVRSAENTLETVKKDVQRSERLYTAGAIPEQTLDSDRNREATAEAALADARARLANAEQRLAKASVRAPFSGVVSERSVSAGDVVQPGTELLTLVDPSNLKLDAAIPVEALALLKVGTPVTFTLSGFASEQFTGRVIRVNPTVDPGTRQVRLEVAVPNPKGRLIAGLFAEGRVTTETHDGLVLPRNAVDVRGLRPVVRRIKAGRVEKVEVILGVQPPSDEQVEVTAGLAPGDTVLLGAAQGIPVGSPIRVRAPNETVRPAATQ